MTGAVAALLPDGRLHLQHGPIDCLCRAWGDAAEVRAAYAQAVSFFTDVLTGLCAELPLLRTPLPSAEPRGGVGQAMHRACLPFADRFITPMAAVAGAVADAVLAALIQDRALTRAFVNNGGDIAFHLAPGQSLDCGLVTELAHPALDGVLRLTADRPSRGVATSGRACKGSGGRSFSLGIADSVTVLATTAAQADAAATIVGNAIDLPGHASIDRRPARDVDPDSDLRDRLVTVGLGALTVAEVGLALDTGAATACDLIRAGMIHGAVLALRGQVRVCHPMLQMQEAA